jgi:hypothetical protein
MRNRSSSLLVAGKRATGILTSPKLIEPFQMGRMISVVFFGERHFRLSFLDGIASGRILRCEECLGPI